MLRNGRTWLLLRPVGRQIWIGPLFRPGLTACWEAPGPSASDELAGRDLSRGPEPPRWSSRGRHRRLTGHDPGSDGEPANAVASWIVRGELPDLESQVQTLDLASWKAETHRLVRLPYCPACGELSGACEDGSDIRPIVLESRLKAISRDNGYRVVQPEVTLKRYGHHVSPITGAVSMLRADRAGRGRGRGNRLGRSWDRADARLHRRS